MSSALAIGAVSAVLRNLLDNGVVDAGPGIGTIDVTAVAPDLIKVDDADAPPSLNLFLYKVAANPGWSNVALPSYNGDGGRLTNPPLALNLHYLLTAYGSSDFQAEILLGYGMYVLHERPVLDRAAIRRALDPTPLGASILPPAFQALSASDLADQVESVTVSLEPTDTEEMARLWSAMQAHYRPTVSYVVSVVLIQATRPARSSLPVLTRAGSVEPDLGPPLPTITSVDAPGGQPAAQLGDTVRVAGAHLDGSGVSVSFTHPLLATPIVRAVPGANADTTGFQLTLPAGVTADNQWPAGLWGVSVTLTPTGEAVPRTTNVAAMLLAPQPVLVPPPTMSRVVATHALAVELDLHPKVRSAQRAELVLGTDVALSDPHPTTTGTLTFHFGDVPDGPQWVRLRVDGVESRLVDRTVTPPAFDATQRVTVPG